MRYYVTLHRVGYTVRERDLTGCSTGREVLRFPVDNAIADGVYRAWIAARDYVAFLNRPPMPRRR